jgi:hypothetical protein
MSLEEDFSPIFLGFSLADLSTIEANSSLITLVFVG